MLLGIARQTKNMDEDISITIGHHDSSDEQCGRSRTTLPAAYALTNTDQHVRNADYYDGRVIETIAGEW